jgi:beta-lactamase regulating signal transducer with metallopeptidase domain
METLLNAGLSNALSATFLALLVAGLGLLLTRRPALVHCFWLLVLVKLVTPPLYELPVPWLDSLGPGPRSKPVLRVAPLDLVRGPAPLLLALDEARIPREALVDVRAGDLLAAPELARLEAQRILPSEAVAGTFQGDWIALLAAIWLAGTAMTLTVTLYRIIRFQLVLRAAQKAAPEVQDWADELALQVGLRQTPSVWFVRARLSPMLWVLSRRPRLIIPTELWKGLGQQERATLIVHELAHLRRGDHRVRFLELAVTALYWWHPVLWWARRALRDAEEQCCDAWVVWAFPAAAKRYAETLLETLDFLNNARSRPEPLLATGFGNVQHLRKRLIMIMSGTTPRILSFWGALGSLSLAALLLPVNATWAQKPAPDEKIEVVVQTDDQPIVLRADELRPEQVDKIVVFSSDGKEITARALPELADVKDVGLDNFDVVEMDALETDGKVARLHLNLKTDDGQEVVVSGSLDEAMKKLKEKLEALAKKSPPSEQDKAQRKALERAVEELGKVSKQIKKIESSGKKASALAIIAKPAEVRNKVVLRRLDELDLAKLSDEQKAALAEARAKVEKLRMEFQAKQKELREAQAKLSKLRGIRAGELTAVLEAPTLKARIAGEHPAHAGIGVGVGVASSEKKTGPASKRRITVIEKRIEKAPSDRERIEKLEKKLKELLEEVSSLKKDAGKDLH